MNSGCASDSWQLTGHLTAENTEDRREVVEILHLTRFHRGTICVIGEICGLTNFDEVGNNRHMDALD